MFVQVLPSLSFTQAIKTCCNKCCSFSGRARRSEYWYLILLYVIVMSVLSILFFFLFFVFLANTFNSKHYNNNQYDGSAFYAGISSFINFIIIITFIFIIPLISAGVRRLHDTGRSGWYYLLKFVPFGDIVLLLFFLEDSQQNENEYGPSPKYIQIQDSSLVNNSQIIPVEGMPGPNSQFSQGYPQANPYQQNNQSSQYSQAPIQHNLYQGAMPEDLPNQEQIVTPMISP